MVTVEGYLGAVPGAAGDVEGATSFLAKPEYLADGVTIVNLDGFTARNNPVASRIIRHIAFHSDDLTTAETQYFLFWDNHLEYSPGVWDFREPTTIKGVGSITIQGTTIIDGQLSFQTDTSGGIPVLVDGISKHLVFSD